MGSCWKARGMMRGSLLLLLQATIIYCANIQNAPKCINGRPGCGEDPVSGGNKTLTLTSLSGILIFLLLLTTLNPSSAQQPNPASVEVEKTWNDDLLSAHKRSLRSRQVSKFL